MSLDQLVNVSVSVSALSPSQQGFGVPLALAYHQVGVGGPLVRSYSGMQEVVQDGHAATSAPYRMLQAMFSQRPRPPVVKLGRRQTAWRQTIDLVPQVNVAGYTYRFKVDNKALTYVVAPTSGIATGAAAPWTLTNGQTLTAAIDGGSAVTATFSGAAAVLTNNDGTATFAAAPGHLDVSINGAAATVIAFTSEATRTAYLSTINTALGALATAAPVSTAGFTVTSARLGTAASLTIASTSTPAVLAALGLTSGQTSAGTGNVANLGAVTQAEFQTLMGAALSGGPGGGAGVTSGLPTVTSPTTGGASSVQMGGTGRTVFGFDNTLHSGSAIALATICTGIAAAINALSGIGCTADGSSGTHVRCTATADGRIAQYTQLDADAVYVTDSSPAEDIVGDLNAVIAADTSWYGLVVDAQSAEVIEAIAPIVETERLIYVSDTNDQAVTDASSTTDVGAFCQEHEYARTFLQYHQDIGCYSAAGLLAGRLTATPGSDTWAYKRIAGVRACELTTQVQGALKAKNVNFYQLNGGVGDTLWGTSSAGEYMDLVRGIDWFTATLQQREVALFRANPKVPYTDPGIASIGNEIDALFDIAESPQVNLITPGTRIVTLPKAANVESADKVARVLNGVEFGGELQGAIHQLNLVGVLAP